MRKYLQKRNEKYYKNSHFHLVADIIFVIVIISLMATFFILRFYKPKSPIDFTLKTLSPTISSGSLTTFELDYKTHKQMTKNNLLVRFPDNFILASVEPANLFDVQSNTITLPDLKSGATGQIKITGIVLGAVGSEQGLALNFNCAECDTGAWDSVFYHIQQSALSLNLNLPDTVYQGVEFPATAVLKNTGDRDLENVVLKINNQWQFSSSDQPLKDGQIMIAKIAKGETKTINFSVLTTVSQSQENLAVEADLTMANQNLQQVEVRKDIAIKIPNFKLTLTPATGVVAANGDLNYTIDYQNNETVALKNLQFLVKANNSNFTLRKVTLLSADKNISLVNNALVFNNDLAADAGGEMKIKVNYQEAKSQVKAQVALSLGLEYNINGQVLKYNNTSAAAKVLSNLQIHSGAYYYSSQGDQLGVGPLPPVVDMATDYWVFWDVSNLGNDLDNVQVSADLSDNVVWTDTKSVLDGDLKHGEVGGRVIWTLDSVPADNSGSHQKVGFEIGIIPTADDNGHILTLLKNIRYSANDKFADQIISGSLRNLDTNLEADSLGSGKGAVLPRE